MFPTRRRMLEQAGHGFGAMALAALMDSECGAGVSAPHHAPRAKRVVHLFMAGGASQVDLFDHKPELIKRDGQPSDFGEKVEAFQNGLGPWLRPQWAFKAHGQCGKMLSETVAPLGAVVDDIAFIHNMSGKTGIHSQATYLQSTGFQNPGFPGMGAWVSYGLGSLNSNLPAFVVMPDHRGYASNGPKNWDSAFLPAQHQGTILKPESKNPITDLFPGKYGDFLGGGADAAGLGTLSRLNMSHAAERPGDGRLEARIASYELAARMQLAAPEALDFSRETPEVLRLYGLDHGRASFDREINALEETDAMGRKCLAARRLLERGVRFVQIWSGNDNGFPRRNWDSHEDIRRDHGPLALGMANAVAALLVDLKRTGLLDDTIVIWTTEFGRMPSSQGGKGRDHNPHGFTTWLAGGGIKGGITLGPSDDFGFRSADKGRPTLVYDVHATVLHLLGINHERLTVRSGGADRRLTDVHGHVIEELLA
ncbi:MAG: DUF1501 domain-containing protein [Planctomycetes bacterium]|nr:DUF1501 domain-containing protein [Planctomycetota bacterium]